MSVVEHLGTGEWPEANPPLEPAERPVLLRSFAAHITPGDGRTVDVRVVPFGEVVEHDDGHGGLPRGHVYREEFMPGVFDHQLNAAHRIVANVGHGHGFSGVVGKAVSLTREADGYHASIRILDGPDGDKALQLIPDVYDGVSLEAQAVKSVRSEKGIVQRVKANLFGIAFTNIGAYKGAKVLAVREEAAQLIDSALLPVDIDPERVERLRAQGIVLPDRYQAHPESDGTPTDVGTPDESAPASGDKP